MHIDFSLNIELEGYRVEKFDVSLYFNGIRFFLQGLS